MLVVCTTAQRGAPVDQMVGRSDAWIVAADPLAALRTLHAARLAVEQITRSVVRDARDAGASWESIDECLHLDEGVAWERYGRHTGTDR